MYMRGYSMRDLDAGILGSSRDTASAPRGRTEIELAQSTASVEPDREPSRSAHVPNRCVAGLQDVRIGDRHIDGALNDGASGVAGDHVRDIISQYAPANALPGLAATGRFPASRPRCYEVA